MDRPGLFSCRFLIAFTQKVAIRRSLLQWKVRGLEIPLIGELNSPDGQTESFIVKFRINPRLHIGEFRNARRMNQNQRYECYKAFTGYKAYKGFTGACTPQNLASGFKVNRS